MNTDYQDFIKFKSLQDEFKAFLQEGKDLKTRVKKLSSEKAWETFVDETDVVESVCDILDGSYYYLAEEARTVKCVGQTIVGARGSHQWYEFQFLVFKQLKDTGRFSLTEDKSVFDCTYGDTAGGCDGILYKVAHGIITRELLRKV
jgi:hypothetical protein